MTTLLNILRIFYLCLAAFYAIVFLSLATIQDTAHNLFWGICGASFGLLMERLLSHYANKRKHKPTA